MYKRRGLESVVNVVVFGVVDNFKLCDPKILLWKQHDLSGSSFINNGKTGKNSGLCTMR